mmetsp:Transcript_26888/g.86840  ORF Transcript_26888/g.86840 Transcript_26888/m.86840 type:complete len:383 (+) Transcript_26888:222-1370(+)
MRWSSTRTPRSWRGHRASSSPPAKKASGAEHHIINETGRADLHCDGCHERPRHLGQRGVELTAGGCVGDAHVLEAHERLCCNHLFGRAAQRVRAALAAAVRLGELEQRRVHEGGRVALFRGEEAVAAGECQAIGLAHRLMDHHLCGEVEVAHQPLDQHALQAILLTKVGRGRLDDVEQLGHHRRHPAKVPRPACRLGRALQALDVHVDGRLAVGLWVHLGLGRREEHVGTRGAQPGYVLLPGARVLVEVLALAKLLWVDKNGRNHQLALAAGAVDQRNVAGVQRAHRGHQRHRRGRAHPRTPLQLPPLLHRVDHSEAVGSRLVASRGSGARRRRLAAAPRLIGGGGGASGRRAARRRTGPANLEGVPKLPLQLSHLRRGHAK